METVKVQSCQGREEKVKILSHEKLSVEGWEGQTSFPIL